MDGPITDTIDRHNGIHINVFLTDRPCLVIGGGKVAARKIALLLGAGANVTVVSPDTSPEVQELIAGDKITHISKTFDPADVQGFTMVYAATNIRAVNRKVLESCRDLRVLCCCVDGNWAEGDFTTPAIARHDELMLSISSGGIDCRQSKLVKNSLERHLKMMDSANLIVVGTDHNCMSVEEREPYHLTSHRFEQAGFMIMQLWGIHEFMILNTCNRVEVIAVVSDETECNGILRHVMGFASVKENKFYLKSGEGAFEHLCLVTAGMLSQTPGENHITAQMKNALETAKERGWAGNMMQEWTSSALHVSKALKNQISPLLHNYEIEDLAIQYLVANGKDLSSSTIMVVGAGTIGKGLIKDCLPEAGKLIWCYHTRKPEIPPGGEDKIDLCTLNEMKNRITEADIIVSATSAPGYVLHMAHAPFFNQEEPVMAIDLGVPRNIDPELDDLSSDVTIVDLDGLKYWYRSELTDMNDILVRCRSIVADHRHLYEKIANSFQGRNASE